MNLDYSAYIADRDAAFAVFDPKHSADVSISAARTELMITFKRDLDAGNKLRNDKSQSLQRVFMKTLKACGGSVKVNPEAFHDGLAEMLTIASSAAVASVRGKLLERVSVAEARRVMVKHPDLVEAVVPQAFSEHLAENADLQIILTNGVKLDFTCQIGLWGGGQQSNRGDKYLAISSKTQTVYHLVADPIPAKALNAKSKKPNKTKAMFTSELSRVSIVYATEIEALVLKHSS